MVLDTSGLFFSDFGVFVGTYVSDTINIIYPVIAWLAMMMLGGVFGRYAINFNAERRGISPRTVMLIGGLAGLAAFAIARHYAGYGDMFLHGTDSTWQQWFHLSKYPPSLTYYGLELGIFVLCLVVLRTIEPRIGVRQNGPLPYSARQPCSYTLYID